MSDPVTFPSVTPRHHLPYLFAGQAQREFFVNESLTRIDMLLHPVVAGIRNDPPSNPQAGQSWAVGKTPSGAWTGYADCLACWQDAQWAFATPTPGMLLRNQGDGALLRFDDSWIIQAAPEPPVGGTNIDAEARACLSAIINALSQFGIFSQSD